MSKNIIEFLESRGLVESLTSDEIKTLCEKPTKVYVGFDPTADSLHVGNLIGIMVLAHFQRFGHTPVVVLGGTTARIGDPSGKSIERPLLDNETILRNVHAIRKHFDQILDFSGKLPQPHILNNDEWFNNMGMIDFLRDVGKHFRIGTMLAKEMVKTRIESEEGLSYTEFSYQIIQGYDFYHLNTVHGVQIQMGGSDQWGNIVSGLEYTRKMTSKPVYGLTWPLLTRSDGKKFGKTAEGAVWLSPERCSPYKFYQYFIGVPDSDVIHMLKMLTFLELDEIAEIEKQMDTPNSAQKRLAEEVTRIVHGEEGLQTALKVTAGAAPGKEAKLDSAVLKEIAADMPSVTLSKTQVLGKTYAELATLSGLLASKGEANRLLNNGGAYLNNDKLSDQGHTLTSDELIDDEFLLLGAGKKKKILIKLEA